MKKTGAQILVDSLIAEKVDVIFGYPGGVVIPIFDVLYDTPAIKVILTRHEQGAAHAADGYARATGKAGVCLATSGPGATNLVTGIATAFLDSVPLIAITGQVASPLLGTDAFQEADVVGITRPITKHNILVTSLEELPRLIREAFHIATSGRPGPVLIDIPVDVTKATLEPREYPRTVHLRGYKPTLVGHPRQIKKAAEAIAQARKPLIYAGGGIICSGAHRELLELAVKTAIPVTTTLMGLGGFPGTHDLFIGMPGMHGSKAANFALQQTDLIISVGCRFDDRVTGHVASFAPHARIIHMDIDPAAISKIIKVDIPVVGDARIILESLTKMVAARSPDEWNEQVAEWKGTKLFSYKDDATVIKPQAVIEELYRQTAGKAIICTEVGQNQMWTAQYYRFDYPRTLLTSGGLGTMGYGMPAAMGAALAFPDKIVVDVAGDGSIQMNIQELATIALNNIAVKIVILNNGYLGMVRQWQQLFYNRRYSKTCLRAHNSPECLTCDGTRSCAARYIPDFVNLARSYSIEAFRATTPAEVAHVLQQGLGTSGPALMEFMVDKEENVFPMVPAGSAIDKIMEEA